MQVQRIQNNNYNQNFRELKIIHDDVPIESWSPETLDSFVRNHAIQEFVARFHNIGKDVNAECDRRVLNKPETDRINLHIVDRQTGEYNASLFYLGNSDITNFNAEERFQECINNMTNDERTQKSIAASMEYVHAFNKSLE